MSKLGFVFLLLMAVSINGQNGDLNFSKINYGDKVNFFNARSLGMGGSGIADGTVSSDFLMNPALGVISNQNLSITVQSVFSKYQEDRSFPYYDNFGGFVDYGSYMFNENWYYNFYGTINYKLPAELIPGLPEISIALGINPLLDFNYDYLEEVRTTGFSDEILAYNKINSEGMQNEISINLSGKVLPNLLVGTRIGFITGEITQKAGIDSMHDSMDDSWQNETNNINLKSTPTTINFGAFFKFDEFLSFGARVSLPVTIKYENDYYLQSQDTSLIRPLNYYQMSSSLASRDTITDPLIINHLYKREIEHPLSLGFGINYKFTNLLLARVNLDFEYTFWSQAKDNLRPGLNWDDTYKIMVGVEHIFFDKVPFRVGFTYQPLRESRNFAKTVLTAGTGMVFDNFTFDLSGGVSSFIFNQYDIFDNGIYGLESRGQNAFDRVETDEFFGVIEISYHFDF